jgi:hypothetical protein
MDLEKYALAWPECSQLVFQSFLQLNQIVVVQSKLSKLIPRNTNTDILSIDVDNEPTETEDDFDPLGLKDKSPIADSCLSFREYASDLLLLCFKNVRKSREVEANYFS